VPIDAFSYFDRTPTCDGRTDRQAGRRRAIANAALAQRRAGKKQNTQEYLSDLHEHGSV